ncbi:hypothetical protein, partial [Escherichia coli]|uniref:hypothetical protein n=1 Tax=Escherichia coli TaxID=562 RepID=UPI001BDC0532
EKKTKQRVHPIQTFFYCLKILPVAYLLSPYAIIPSLANMQLIIVTNSVVVKSHRTNRRVKENTREQRSHIPLSAAQPPENTPHCKDNKIFTT